MSAVLNIVLSLAAALIGYLIGRLWETFLVRRRCWMAREFWHPVLDGTFQVVISKFDIPEFREPTGVVGGGDAIANRLLSELFQDIGLERPKSVYVDEHELDRKNNLVVLGGPAENKVARQICDRLRPGMRVVDPGPGVAMQVEMTAQAGGDWAAPLVHVAEPGQEMTEYGVIIRAPSPFAAGRTVVVIQGAYGYGTWAGVGLTQSKDFLARCESLDHEHSEPRGRIAVAAARARRRMGFTSGSRAWVPVECLYKVDVVDGHPTTTEILALRRMLPVTGGGPSSPRVGTDRPPEAAGHP
ncbi:hypothetical protein ASC64_20875 [Nocardioides sp. Root122]|uniref:hypothetical protein n=1 Tax=Nocardioides TaxID=1839 RepID=UPI000702F2E8|nr:MULTISPECIES: hypothetical protein [Nocardioides]KQV72076.1 hypothetical protein ASC64_20875 [Nocardioides sp. Root122]MCK9824720.1 hypothetical protein [Nocardioides cavernae]